MADLGLARAAAAAGDRVKSRQAYQEFSDRWMDADRNLPLLKKAAAELAALPE